MRRPSIVVLLAALSAGIAGCGSSSSHSSSAQARTGTSAQTGSPTTTAAAGPSASTYAGRRGFEQVPIEAGAPLGPSTTGTGTVDGIPCGSSEVLTYHVHAHVQVYVSGEPRELPGGIGIPGSSQVIDPQAGPFASGGDCIYWMHTHAPDGVIHIEAPSPRVYTLGTFFDIWHQPLSASQVAGARGAVAAFVNGKPWHADPRAIPLTPHAVVQLSVGQPVVPFRPMSWTGLNL